MVFLRTKKINGKEYAYAVENKWKGKGSRQRVKNYIGRAYRLKRMNEIDFSKFLNLENIDGYIESVEKNKIINDLIEWELSKHGITKQDFLVDLKNFTVKKNKKYVALILNEGFMCGYTLKKICEFKKEGDEAQDGYRLARAFVDAGIKIPQDIFIGLFGKL